MKTSIRNPFRALLLVACLASVPFGAAAATTSELLEKGIYNEETKGDLDTAITIYQQLVGDGKSAQSLAAQAQFRLGQCYLKKSRTAEATAAFEKLISDFPNEKELVAKAREHLPAEIALGPVPWVDGEWLQLKFILGADLEFGATVYRADLAESDGRKVWRVGARTLVPTAQGVSIVEVDAETFRPLTSRWKHSILGEASAVYKKGEVEVQRTGAEQPFTINLDKAVFDNEEVVHMMRRLPLEAGYKTTIPVIATLGGKTIIPVGIEVKAKEMVEVPAGKFDCFKVELNIGQTFWYSDDVHRYLVKFEAGGATALLTSITQRKAGEAVQFNDAELGVSLTAPPDWVVFRPKGRSGKKEMIALFDPEADLEHGQLLLIRTDSLSETARQSSRAWAETGFKEAVSKELKDAKIRPESWKNYDLAGRPGVSYIVDYKQGDKPRVGFALHVLGPKTSEEFNMACTPEKFDALKAAFDNLLATYRITK